MDLRFPLGEFVFIPGCDPRPVDLLPHSDVSQHLLHRRRDGGEISELRVGVDADHIEALAARAAAGLPITTGYHGSRTLAGFDAE